MKLEYIDRVYGKVSISNPVALEIIESPSMQRLEGIDSGGFTEAFRGKKYHSRREHSIGVYALLQRVGARMEEQFSGLIHDLSHPVGSHSVDYLAGGNGAEESHQDKTHDQFVRASEIPNIFSKYPGFSIDRILDDSSFTLKETSLPDLCADRIDYGLRGALDYDLVTQKEVRETLDALLTKKGKWMFADVKSAREFSEIFREMNNKYWASFADAKKDAATGAILQYMLENNLLIWKDLYTTDAHVLKIMRQYVAQNKTVQKLFARLQNKVNVVNDKDNFDVPIQKKSRVVDPLCWHGHAIVRLSDVEKDWKKIVEEEQKPKEYFLKYLD